MRIFIGNLCKIKLSKFSFANCQKFLFKLSKIPFSNCQKISFSNCQNIPFQTVKIFLSKLSKFSFSNCQNFPFQTVKIFLFKLSKFSFSKLSKFSFSNCQNFLFQTVKIFWVSQPAILSSNNFQKIENYAKNHPRYPKIKIIDQVQKNFHCQLVAQLSFEKPSPCLTKNPPS